MLVEDLPDVRLVVLGHKGEKDALGLQVEQARLNISKGRAGELGAEANAVEAVFADDAPPERVIAVDRDDLARSDPAYADEPRELFAQALPKGLGERLTEQVALAAVVGLGVAERPHEGVEAHESHVGRHRQRGREALDRAPMHPPKEDRID